MPKTERELSKELGIERKTINNHKKKLGITGKTLTEEEENELKYSIEQNKIIKQGNLDNLEKLQEANSNFKPSVREIDKINYSSMEMVLQDAKERYVKNEELIQRLQNEIDSLDVTMNGNINGTVSSIPQLATVERFIKLNLALRNQILEIEEKLGRNAKADDSDPFK